MHPLDQEIEAIRKQILALQREKTQIQIQNPQITPENNSPEAIATAYRNHARETAHQSAEVKGIEDAIAALKIHLRHKQQELEQFRRSRPTEEQLEESRQQAKLHADRINQLSRELQTEAKALKAIADEITPLYWQVYYKPFITGFSNISVPYVRSDGDVWTILNKLVWSPKSMVILHKAHYPFS